MHMLTGDQIAAADLTDWRKLAQALHARYLVDGFAAGDLRLLSDDAVHTDDEGAEHLVEWVTQQDLDLARRITQVAAEQTVTADPASITTIELALDTAHSARIGPVWAAC